MLTGKQEKFVQELLAGKSQRQAYMAAYPSSRKWKPKTIDEAACKLMKNSKVFTRFNELKKEQEEERKKQNLWTYREAVEKLKWLVETASEDVENRGVKQANVTAIISAVKELNDLAKVEAEPEKDETDGFIDALQGKVNDVW